MNRRTILADVKTSTHASPARTRVGALTESQTSFYRGLAIGTVVIVSLWLFFRELKAA